MRRNVQRETQARRGEFQKRDGPLTVAFRLTGQGNVALALRAHLPQQVFTDLREREEVLLVDVIDADFMKRVSASLKVMTPT